MALRAGSSDGWCPAGVFCSLKLPAAAAAAAATAVAAIRLFTAVC